MSHDENKYNPDIIDKPIQIIKPPTITFDGPNIIEINDIRSSSDFRGISFSNYKRSDVKKKLIDAMQSKNIEPACYWCAELLCAGHYTELWEIILYYSSKHIHLGNPKIAIYLELRYNIFRNIVNQGTNINELDLRNNEKIRKLFAEIICTLCLSNKKPSFEQTKIKTENAFDMTQLSSKLKAPNTEYVRENMKPKDPKELFIALNEFSFSLSHESSNMCDAFYWLEWMLEFETTCKKKKQVLKCEHRSGNVENKYRGNIIWIIWDILLDYCQLQSNELVKKTMISLNKLFCIKYTDASNKKRRYLLYYSISLLTEHVNTNVEILPNKTILQSVLDQIETVYKQIKKNEQAPKTEYLFQGIDKKRALEKSLKQMEIVNSIINT